MGDFDKLKTSVLERQNQRVLELEAENRKLKKENVKFEAENFQLKRDWNHAVDRMNEGRRWARYYKQKHDECERVKEVML